MNLPILYLGNVFVLMLRVILIFFRIWHFCIIVAVLFLRDSIEPSGFFVLSTNATLNFLPRLVYQLFQV